MPIAGVTSKLTSRGHVTEGNPLATIAGGNLAQYNANTNSYDQTPYTHISGGDYYRTPTGQMARVPAGGAPSAGGDAGGPSNEQRQLAADLRSSLNLGNNVASQSSTQSGASAAPKTPEAIAAPNFGPGTDAALLRAKEQQGQIARSALTGLRSVLGERQMLGGGAETGATQDIAAKALQSLTDVNREGLIQQDETARQQATLGYQGALQQRGQDITARGQDIAAQQGDKTTYFNTQQAILNALKALQY